MKENRVMISIRVPPAKLERLDAWRNAQLVPPDRTATLLAALDKFLDEHGAPPEPVEKKRGKK